MDIGYIVHKLQKSYLKLQNWRDVGAEFGITGGMAWRIARQGYEPKDAGIRIRLGLPARAMVPVCRRCGIVHVSKRCSRRRRVYRELYEMPEEVLRWKMENREVMEGPNPQPLP
jgi:hypothetical protein